MRQFSLFMLQRQLRLKILKIANLSKSSHCHIGSCLSCIDILIQTLIYEMGERDKFVLSKGHASLALYVVLNYLGKISDKTLSTYFQNNTKLGIHTPSTLQRDIPLGTGSLGHGLSFSCGLALGNLMANKQNPRNVYCLISDGECNEGAIWEAALFATAHKLYNLIIIVDKNGLQAFGKTKDILGDGAAIEKWKSFGFNTYECDGHNLNELKRVFNEIKINVGSRPNIVICKTVRGKGLKVIENKVVSNYVSVDEKLLNSIYL
ncbi:hypothetical protein A2960_00960 [Candidatus Gottesmanbacteria bacterium RIFCSPLOWO2_01_FULL_39_12b]|uniref:Transketolase N-terminal domain-containing protein n=1 Tax=Candidatus Gottesmanbacteria bacterium RIFCSPLOWO2_01_FULL_39_12b TaxID=1798388 RepID=A0A1F6APV8_9BACT|nr:MAG: hypothetical protein A2960_00960 [Candidatus Gottesmanbacteria bacterium RIFCSPLOWO2_01_FULL_39_12b]